MCVDMTQVCAEGGMHFINEASHLVNRDALEYNSFLYIIELIKKKFIVYFL